MARKGVALQGKRQQREVFHRPVLPRAEYTHKITLQSGQSIAGTLSAIVYVQAAPSKDPERYLLHTRDKGNLGTDLKALVYVRSIRLGEKALEEGKRKVANAKGHGTRK